VLPFPATLDRIERAAAQAMLELHGGNKSAAAAALGISRSRLYRILDSAASAAPPAPASRAETDHALAVLAAGDSAGAEAAAEAALARSVRAGESAGQADALRVLGVVALASGRLDEARVRLAAALDGARRSGATLLEAESLEALAAAELAAGDEARAAGLRADAERAFAALGLHALGRQLRARMAAFAAASFSGGDPAC
jgi:hypothetical protein